MALASLLGGMALANAKLGAVHGIAGPLGGQFPAPHGATCASLLAPVMEINLRALNAREPENRALQRYEEVARILTGNPHASAMDGAKWVSQLCKELQIPPLSGYGLKKSDFPTLVVSAARASSMQGNPIELTENELAEILDRAVG